MAGGHGRLRARAVRRGWGRAETSARREEALRGRWATWRNDNREVCPRPGTLAGGRGEQPAIDGHLDHQPTNGSSRPAAKPHTTAGKIG